MTKNDLNWVNQWFNREVNSPGDLADLLSHLSWTLQDLETPIVWRLKVLNWNILNFKIKDDLRPEKGETKLEINYYFGWKPAN